MCPGERKGETLESQRHRNKNCLFPLLDYKYLTPGTRPLHESRKTYNKMLKGLNRIVVLVSPRNFFFLF